MKVNPIIALVVVVALAGGAFWYYSSNGTSQTPLSVSGATTQSGAQTRFETLLGKLKPISFDTSIFSNPNFQILVDISTPVQPETTGRPDPFAPFTSAGAVIPNKPTTSGTSASGTSG